MNTLGKHSFGTIFGSALTLSAVGPGLIWAGDGHVELYRRGMVVLGLILTIVGIGLLRYLLYSGVRKKETIAGTD